MSDELPGQWPPPPGGGWSAQGTPSGWPPAPPAWSAGAVPPPFAPPAHRPGAIPLRPLTLGDIFDSSFRIIRHNAGATVGAAVLVAAVSMLVPVAFTALLTFGGWADLSTFGTDSLSDELAADPSAADSVAFAAVAGSLVLGMLLQSIGLLFVTAMGARVTAAAALGRRLRLTEAWAETRGTRWRVLGLSALLALVVLVAVTVYLVPLLLLALVGPSVALAVGYGLLGGLALVCFLVWLGVRFAYLATPALVLERQGIRSALARSRVLTRGSFWRLLGIGLLTAVVAGVASQVVSIPLSVLSLLVPTLAGPEYALLGSTVGQAAGTVVSAAFTTPFLAVVAAVQYHDQRIRREAFDVVLMEQAGLTGDAAP